MRRFVLSGIALVALAALAWAPAASAQCAETLKKGASFEFATAAADGKVLQKGTVTVSKNDGSYVEFKVTVGKDSMTMPGGIEGGQVVVTNSKNGNVWFIKCTAEGLEGTSSMAGKATRLGLTKRK